MKNYIIFPSSDNVLISSSFLKDIFHGYRVLDWQLFFSAFKNIVSLPLASMVSDEKFTCQNCFSSEGKVMFFSCCFQDFFFVFSFQKFDYDMFWCGFLCFFPCLWCVHTLKSACLLLTFGSFGPFLAYFMPYPLSPLFLGLQWHKCFIF